MGFSRLIGVVDPETQIPLSSIGMRRFNSSHFPDNPQIAVTGAFSLGFSVNADQGVAQNTFHWVDTLSWTKGKHQVKFGLEARRYQDNYYSNNRMRGTMTLQSFGDLLLGLSGTSIAEGGNGTGFSNINTSSVASGVAQRADRMTDMALFVQDDWKVNGRLTLNLGLRWDYLGLAVDRGGRNGSFDTRLYQPLSLPSYVRTDLQAASAVAASLQNPYPDLPQREQFPVVPQLFAPPILMIDRRSVSTQPTRPCGRLTCNSGD